MSEANYLVEWGDANRPQNYNEMLSCFSRYELNLIIICSLIKYGIKTYKILE
jgi:hypothetical protein